MAFEPITSCFLIEWDFNISINIYVLGGICCELHSSKHTIRIEDVFYGFTPQGKKG